MSPATELDNAPTEIAPGDPLLDGTRVRDYEIRGLIGEGGFAIVYLAWDHSLQRQVALKEFMPASIASRVDGSMQVAVRSPSPADAETFATGLRSFLDEARLLARFDHPSLVKVYRFWEENGTAYLVMPYYEGPTLSRALATLGHVPSEDELRAWLRPVLNALTVLHEAGVWHQNIGPDAIVLTPTGPVLLGLSSAGHAIEAVQRVPAAALKRGFAAIEQYGGVAGAALGPSTDLYALAALVYLAITGSPPAPAPERLGADPVMPLGQIATGLYSAGFLAAIDGALAVQPTNRPADHAQFRALMGDIEAPEAPVSLAPRLDLMQEPFLASASSHREITVPDRPFLVPTRPDPPVPDIADARARLEPAGAGARDAQAEGDAPNDQARGSPSWMGRGQARNLGKRALYGVVAATCVGIGLVALALNVYLRPPARTPGAASAPVAAAPSSSAGSAPAPIAAPAGPPAVIPAASPASLPAVGTAAASAAVVPAAPPATASVPVPAPSAPAALPPTVAVVATPPERQARCIDILQKASLERISAADTEFFKKECK